MDVYLGVESQTKTCQFGFCVKDRNQKVTNIRWDGFEPEGLSTYTC